MSDRFFTYEMQHIFPREIQSSTRPEAQAARDLLSQIGFDLETLGNKIALLTQGETIAAYNDAPPEIWAALEAAGFGRNRHDSQSLGGNHPGYNKFLIDTLAEIKLRSDRLDCSPEARELAVYDLHRFIAKIKKKTARFRSLVPMRLHLPMRGMRKGASSTIKACSMPMRTAWRRYAIIDPATICTNARTIP